uniref:Glutamyl-tRNA(Gln) amidotransferase subunit C, mitochondrial n=1 Tax=Syphacia muris TaxID=451379 RepID=A0A0N5ATL0_9BILA
MALYAMSNHYKFLTLLKHLWPLTVRRVSSFGGDLPDSEVLVPRHPCKSRINQDLVEEPPEFDQELVNHLERMSLVRFSNEEAVAHLRMAVRYANQLMQLDIENVKPLETVLEDLECPLRDDIADETLDRNDVLSNAEVTFEGYFVTPPGNIPLQEVSKLDLEKVNEWDWHAMSSQADSNKAS